MNPLNAKIGNLDKAVSDVYYTTRCGLFRPDYTELLIDLYALDKQDALLPKPYQSSVLRPFTKYLEKLGETEFNKIFHGEEHSLTVEQKSLRKSVEEVAEALLQRNHQHKYYESSFNDLKAFQAVVTTIYDDILNSQVSHLVRGVLAPLAKWGGNKGPYTLPRKQTIKVGVNAGIVSLPSEHRTGGLLGWASLGHEVAGHNVLHIHEGLIPEIQEAIRKTLTASADLGDLKDRLADYWAACAEEAASDVLAVLNTGHSFGIGLIGYLRGKRGGRLQKTGMFHTPEFSAQSVRIYSVEDNAHNMFVKKLGNDVKLEKERGLFGYLGTAKKNPLFYEKIFFPSGKHPVDILRPFVISRIIEFYATEAEQHEWITLIEAEALKDLEGKSNIVFHDVEKTVNAPGLKVIEIPIKIAIASAKLAAEVIARAPLKCLEGRCLSDLVSWTLDDEIIVSLIRQALQKGDEHLPDLPFKGRFYARHVIAASVLESVKADSRIETIFLKMKVYLVDAYGRIPMWNIGDHTKTVSLPADPSFNFNLGKEITGLYEELEKLEFLENGDPRIFEGFIEKIRRVWIKVPKGNTEFNNLFQHLFTRACSLKDKAVQKSSSLSVPGLRIYGTKNQYTLARQVGAIGMSSSSCTVNVIAFLSRALKAKTIKAWTSDIVDQILEEGRGYFEQITAIRRKERQVVLADADENVRAEQAGDTLHVAEIPQIEERFSLLQQGGMPTEYLRQDKDADTTVLQFSELLMRFEKELSSSGRPSLGVVIQCNGSTYGLVLFKGQSTEFAIFDSHGSVYLNKTPHAFICWTLDLKEAARFLGNLIHSINDELQDLSPEEQELIRGDYQMGGLNQMAINFFREAGRE